MNHLICSLSVLLASGLLSLAAEEPACRVVRLMQSTNAPGWRFTVDGAANEHLVSNIELTNNLAAMRMHQGDVMLLGTLPNRKPGPLQPTWEWICHYCDSNQVAVYLYGVYSPSQAIELFFIPVYHWSTPFDKPQSLSQARFFLEGKLMGRAADGLESTLNDIRKRRAAKVFVLGSFYDMNRSFPPNASPYEGQRSRLEDIAK